jgi:hypothetical protein
MNEEHIIIWEPPVIVPPTFRLYYDDRGKVLFYTCEKPEGNFIEIDAQTYAECRHDLRVIDGKLVRQGATTVSRLRKSDKGTLCEQEDMSIITTDNDGQYWELETYEL